MEFSQKEFDSFIVEMNEDVKSALLDAEKLPIKWKEVRD